MRVTGRRRRDDPWGSPVAADLAQHFIVSAVIAAAGGTPIAAAAGVYKELNDARDGSGFSFSDIAADRAGRALRRCSPRSLKQSAREIAASRRRGRP